ncbi:efflux RND transporter permease subunit [Bdellovibrio svalbardensis]|uniref:CusA/CzcA family heavy metal efflux RND transporter n=1 Tax=Bdellovibrio svalbardensis TaxID=2972972 RepID=A0ABT6DIK5_9BACT|nr:CusA/CzcA family heavy metal efflux RND transporter [Bdellovibrio svalbardensis]MDG0815764.1 CusA/CzcA family heavy metal efflux RND transporter [Bdellovibrio svalbardensis]
MINKIIHFSVYNRALVLLFTVMVAIAGVYSFQHLPIDAVPDITNNQVQINTTIEGLAPEEIERSITYPIESSMRGIAGVLQVRSITRFGLSQVTVVFKDAVDVYRARQMVTERLQGVLAELPKGAEAKLGPISTGLGEIFQYTLDYEKPATDSQERLKQLMEVKALQDWFIKPRLLTVEGVAEINTTGGYEKQYHVQPDIKKMASYGIHFEEIVTALEKVNRNVGGGYIAQTAEQFLVQGVGLFKTAKDIEKVPVKQLDSFRVIRVGDIAKVRLGKELRTGAATYNGQETVLGTVMMLLGENSRTVATRVKDKVDEVRKTLPAGMEMTTVYNRSDLVDSTLGTVEHNLILGATLVIVILFLLIGNIRAAVITAITIPLSLLATFLVMKPLGLSGNLMSLGALDFGIIVDGTVILIDNCVRYVHERSKALGRKLSPEEVQAAVYEAAVEVRVAAGFGELIVVVVFLPIFALTGVEGKMFTPMAATFAIAVASALILSFTTAPALASLILKGNAEDKEPQVMQWIRKVYTPLFNLTFRHRLATLVMAGSAVIVGAVLFASRGAEFLPQLSEGSFAFHMIRPVNLSLDQSIAFQLKADQIVKDFPEVDKVFSRIGTSEVATDPMGVNISDTYIMLKERSDWPKSNEGQRHSYETLVNALVARLEKELPGQNYLASQPIQMRFNELLEGTRADVSVKIFGPDLQVNMDLAKKVQEIVAKVPGAGDVEVDLAGTSPVLRVKPKEEAIRKYGANESDVMSTISIALGGQESGFLYENERKFPIVVRLSDEERSDLSTIRNLPVGLGTNTTTPLANLATSEFSETFSSINREDSNRRSAVLINLRGRDTESFVNEAQKVVEQEIKLPQGYYMQWGGNFKNLQEARSRLMVLTPIALVLVLLMIYAAFRSIGQTMLIFACIPFALVGGVLGLIANGLPFSISAGVGFIALSGIAVLNGVVLVNYFNQLKTQGLTGKELVLKGTLVRLRPVLMTALVAIFGFLPMMLSTGIGAEVQRPLASVVIGGIVSSTILTLIVLPTLYSIFENKFKGRVAH